MGLNNFKTPHEGGEYFYGSGFDPIVSMSQNPNFGDSSMVSTHGAFAGLNVIEMIPKFPEFGNYTSICPENYCQLSEETASPNGKRKRVSDPNKTEEVDAQQDLSGETSEQKGSDEKKQKMENSHGEETTKENYVHMRARRGQATNSHSLAERVRRERISERMRALQELVPGCSKITGKAVMLDEIINYVQSLQQQVEFLSMKLATVSPELNFDMNRILSKDILHLRGGDTPLLGFNPGTSSSHPYAPGIHQGAYHSLPQGTWDGDIQGLFHTGFNSNLALANLGANGSSRPEP